MSPNFVTEYLERVKVERGATAAKQSRYMLRMLPATITPRALDNWRTGLRAGALAPSSINRILSETKTFLLWLIRTERISADANKLKDVLCHYRVEHPKPVLPGPERVRTLLERALGVNGSRGRNLVLAINLGLFAGLRPGEIDALQGPDIQSQPYLHIRHTKTGTARHAWYRHSQVLCRVLPELKTVGKLVRGWDARFCKLARAVGWEPAERNVLRKLAASYMACSGVFSEYELMQTIGHTTTVSIQHYRDPAVFSVIQPGGCIEQWMGVGDLSSKMAKVIIG